jgi:nucleoside-diphosphate-sugar epimerase
MPQVAHLNQDTPVLVTGGAGFIGARVVQNLVDRGFRHIRCFTRRLRNPEADEASANSVEWIHGNLHSHEDCKRATKNVQLIIHLAAGTGTKSYADAFLNSVVTTRNLLDAAVSTGTLKRFVNVSSFAVYSNQDNPVSGTLDESSPIAQGADRWRDAYTYAKICQDELVEDYGRQHGVSYVHMRPGAVYGPGKKSITGRVGINPFGLFLHLGGGNPIPFTYVDNCAEAMVLAGLTADLDQDVFNIVDDDLPSSRRFLRQYKKRVGRFRSLYLPHFVSYFFCYCWDKYYKYSNGQLPRAYSPSIWHSQWKKTRYRNEKLKTLLEWNPKVSTEDGMSAFFEACRKGAADA